MTIIEEFLKLIAPHECVGCGQLGGLLCKGCQENSIVRLPSRCFLCKKITQDFRSCSNCYNKTKLRHVWIASEYEEPVNLLIQKFKYQRAKEAHKILGDFLAEALPYGVSKNMLITHVPTARRRIRERGYDQCELIARRLTQKLGGQYGNLLIRTTSTRQVGSSRYDRLHQMDNAFMVVRPSAVVGKEILLVDDVVTTGASLASCAKTLKSHGAKSVSAIVVAQTHE